MHCLLHLRPNKNDRDTGYPRVDLSCKKSDDGDVEHTMKEISSYGLGWLVRMETNHKGCLHNNCGYELWRKRYARAGPLARQQPDASRPLSSARDKDRPHISQWSVLLPRPSGAIRLFGCTEDIRCEDNSTHLKEYETHPFVRKLCLSCLVPLCVECCAGLAKFKGEGSIPMSYANDHYYGFIRKYLVEEEITWLECAAASLVWTTLLVTYLEEAYGHLMTEQKSGAMDRTQVKGSIFSFPMKWEDVERCCKEATERQGAQLPHNEEALSSLVRILGGRW